MKNAVVTGATGLVGRWVVAELLNHNVKVYALVRNRKKANVIFRANKKLNIIEYDFEGNIPIKCIVPDGVDVFYHFAWGGVSGEKQSDFSVQLANIEGTLKLAEQLGDLGVKKFIGAGSLHEAEFIEEMNMETTNASMGIMYKSAKLSAHYMTKAIVCRQGIQFNWPIITNTFGIGERTPRLVNSTIRKLLNKESPQFTMGYQLYDFVYITDIARAFRLIGEKGISCRNYILGSGKCRPLREFLECIGRIVNPQIPLLFGNVPFNGIMLPSACFDVSSLAEDTGFRCKTSFVESIEYMKQWILEGEKDVQI